jgi:hypothetical protein
MVSEAQRLKLNNTRRGERAAGIGQVRVVDGCADRVGRAGLAGRNGCGRDLGQSEIENLGVSALGDEDVGRV